METAIAKFWEREILNASFQYCSTSTEDVSMPIPGCNVIGGQRIGIQGDLIPTS